MKRIDFATVALFIKAFNVAIDAEILASLRNYMRVNGGTLPVEAVADNIVLHTDKIHYTEIERNLVHCSYWRNGKEWNQK